MIFADFSFEFDCARLNVPNPDPIPEKLSAFLHSKHKICISRYKKYVAYIGTCDKVCVQVLEVHS